MHETHAYMQPLVQVPDGFAGADLSGAAARPRLAAPGPREPGRYLLPEDSGGLRALTRAAFVVRLLVQLHNAYVALHGAVLIALIVLIFAQLAQLPRIRTIVVTLAESVGPVIEFCAVMIPLVVCLAVSGGLSVGGPRCACAFCPRVLLTRGPGSLHCHPLAPCPAHAPPPPLPVQHTT